MTLDPWLCAAALLVAVALAVQAVRTKPKS